MSVTAKSLITMIERTEELFGDSFPMHKNTIVCLVDYTVGDSNDDWHWMPFVVTGNTEKYTNSELLKYIVNALEESGIKFDNVRSISAFDNPTNEIIEHVMNNAVTMEDSKKATFIYIDKDAMAEEVTKLKEQKEEETK